MKSTYDGFLTIVAIVMILLGSFVAVTLARITANSAMSVVSLLKTQQAFYAATAGLERGAYVVMNDG